MIIKRTITIDTDGYETQTDYDKHGNETYFKDNHGYTHKYEYEYDDNKRLIKRHDLHYYKDKFQNSTSYTYDEVGNIISIVYPHGHRWEYKYDENNNKIASICTGDNIESIYEYDDQNRLIRATGGDENYTCEYLYDPEMETTTCVIKNKNGKILETIIFNKDMRRLYSSSSDDTYRVYKYDDHGNCIEIINSDNTFIKMKYNSNGDLIDRSMSNGHHSSTIYEYWTEKELQED